MGCKVSRAQSWALRCQMEASQHATSSFVTLTYSTASLPKDWSLQHGEGSSWDLQRFYKRLRKAVGPFRYFSCGEYGTENLRPHYHALLFGVSFPDREVIKEGESFRLYTSRRLESLWTHGFVTVGDVSFQSAAYVAKYCLKRQSEGSLCYRRTAGTSAEAWYVRPEFSVMSRRPGIGARWFERFAGDVFPADEVVHEGRRYRPPRYFETKLSEADLAEVKRKRMDWLKEHPERKSWSQLEAEEFVLEQRARERARGL